MESDCFVRIRESCANTSLIPDADWAGHTSLGAGTASFALAEVSGRDDLVKIVHIARSAGFCVFPLGAGTNLAGSDRPLPSVLFVHLARGGEFSAIAQSPDEPSRFRAGAACFIGAFLSYARECGYGGATGLSGIPGTLGGLVKMNAGACGQTIGDYVVSLEVLDLHTGAVRSADRNEFLWEYRNSGIPDDCMVLSVDLQLQKMDPAVEIPALEAERKRRASAPKGRSAGSVFRNPSPDLPAGRLLEECGVKGLTAGAYRVSAEHANWIVSDPAETQPRRETDVASLIETMKDKVYRQKSITLRPEIRFVSRLNTKLA